MPGESDDHRRLKEAACWWLWNQGFRAVAAEVPVHGIGVVDAAAVGRPGGDISRAVVYGAHAVRPGTTRHNAGSLPNGARPGRRPRRARRAGALWQAVIVECKSTRSDFLREAATPDQVRQAVQERRRRILMRFRGRPCHRHSNLGKFAACLARPMANVHWLLTPPDLVRINELPPRWGLLEQHAEGIRAIHPAQWQQAQGLQLVESAIARTLTASIYAADTRAVTNSLNRLLRKKQIASAHRMVQSLDDLAGT
ncbi:MAG: hypothetical protein JSU68_08790 [Phycisphaerales bacterium]|nr:MAG: hypothetical protein JSU68_08790 [Phycisphaerales bacterium]